jgi:hypothetical protein
MRLLKNHEEFDEKEKMRFKQKKNINPTMPDEVKNAIRDLDKELVGESSGLSKQAIVL